MPTPKTKAAAEDLLDALPRPIQGLARRGTIRQYRARTTLIQEGDQGDTLFVILAGTVRIYCADANGKEITLALYGPGEYVGEMSLDGGPRSASVATETACTCALVSGGQVRGYVSSNPEFAMELIHRLISRARLATDSARSLALLDAYGRLTRLFNQLATPRDGETRLIKEALTHLAISKRIGCTRELVSRILKDLEVGGYLAVENRRYILLKKLPAKW
jgi:CRP/FNR family cyclic AMP-dependent transcriptional regulator